MIFSIYFHTLFSMVVFTLHFSLFEFLRKSCEYEFDIWHEYEPWKLLSDYHKNNYITIETEIEIL